MKPAPMEPDRSPESSLSNALVLDQSSVAAWNETRVCFPSLESIPAERPLPSGVSVSHELRLDQLPSSPFSTDVISVERSGFAPLAERSVDGRSDTTTVTLWSCPRTETTESSAFQPSSETMSPSTTTYIGEGLLWNSSEISRKSSTTGTESSKLSLVSNPTSNWLTPTNMGAVITAATMMAMAGLSESLAILSTSGLLSVFTDLPITMSFGGTIVIRAGSAVMLNR